MKQTRLLILFVCTFIFANTFASTRYWVGGTAATWDASTTTCWSETSGGTSGASVPVAGDDVIFDNSTNANSTNNASPTVTLGVATPALNSITFTSSNVTFVGAKTITTNNMTIDNSQVAFVSVVTINSALTFSSTSGTTTTPRFSHSSAAGSAITLGNGGAFTLTGNSATNYFTGTSNSSFRYNTTSALTVFFKAGITISGIYVYKGLITLGNNLALPRLNFPPANLNNQELIVAPNITLTLSGGASSGYTELAGGGTINASASGSKVLITQTPATSPNTNVLNTTGRVFKANTTINNLEVNTTGNMVLGFPITVRTLTKTAGTITTTSTNKITIAAGGNVVEGAATISGTAVEPGVATTRYWVGGSSGNWFNEANWGTSSGNTDTDRIPEYGDNVVFDNSGLNVNPTVTLTDHVTAADINFSGSNVTFAGADSIKTNSMTVNSSQVQFVDHVKVNSSLTFSGTDPRITQLSTTSGRAFICGNGGAFTLNGNSATNYFTGNTNAYYTFNTTSSLTVYFNPTTTTAGALVVTKGLITLGNNINTNRLTLSATNSQELILSENVTLNITGGGTSTFTDLTNGGVINASATGSKVLITSTAPTFLNAGGTKRIFKDATTINHLEMNSNGQTFVPAYQLSVKNLTLTEGTINNSTNNITINTDGAINRTSGLLSAPPVFTGPINVNIWGTTSIAGNELLGTTGHVGTLTVNNGANYTLNAGSITVADLTIAPGAQLTNSATLTATNLTINSNATDGTGTYLDNGTTTVTGTTTVNQSFQHPAGALRTWYVTPPVASSSPSGMSIIKSYDELTYSWSAHTPTMLAKKGYQVVPAAAANNIMFTGTLNNANQNVSLISRDGTADKAGFNLIGNPYPSYLDWSLVTNPSNTAVMRSTTMWYRTKKLNQSSELVYQFWTVNGDGVTSPNGASSKIPPMQAFWVRANSGGGTLALTNEMRSHAPATDKLLKAPAAKNNANTLVRLQVNNGTNTDETVLYFSANASNGIDPYDAPKMSNDNVAIPEIYTTLGTEQIVINGMNTIPLDTPIGLGFVAGNASTFSLTANEISNLPSGLKLILKDNVTKTETDLTDGVSTYQFSPAVTSSDRFSVIFRTAGAVTSLKNTQENSIIVYNYAPQQLTVICNDKRIIGSMLEIYNTMGQKLISLQLTGTSMHIGYKFIPGVYMVKVNNTTKKVIVN